MCGVVGDTASEGERLRRGLFRRDREERRALKFEIARITQRRWVMRRVKAWLTSSSLGGSTGSEQFSSASRSGSAPSLVTHGCS